MEFARKQLEKYGWKEGQGLGRKEEGIAKPIKVGIKRDHGGVGLVPGEDFSSHWWTSVFNKAVSSISVDNSGDGVMIETVSGDEASLSLKQKHYGMHQKSLLYGGFLQSSPHKEVSLCDACDNPPSEMSAVQSVSDEELLKACGGRTAHKAARHGLKLSGKLRRLQSQETFLEEADTQGALHNDAILSPDHISLESRQVDDKELSGTKLSEENNSINVRGATSRSKKRRRIGGAKVENTESLVDGAELHVLEKRTSCPGYKSVKKGDARHQPKLEHKHFTGTGRELAGEVAKSHKKKGKKRKSGSTETVQ